MRGVGGLRWSPATAPTPTLARRPRNAHLRAIAPPDVPAAAEFDAETGAAAITAAAAAAAAADPNSVEAIKAKAENYATLDDVVLDFSLGFAEKLLLIGTFFQGSPTEVAARLAEVTAVAAQVYALWSWARSITRLFACSVQVHIHLLLLLLLLFLLRTVNTASSSS